VGRAGRPFGYAGLTAAGCQAIRLPDCRRACRLTVCQAGELSGCHRGPEGCMVESSLGDGGLAIGGAGLSSGGWGMSSLGEEP